MCILFGGLSLQEDCQYLLYPSVGILVRYNFGLHSSAAGKPITSLSTNLPRDVRFYFERLFGVVIGVPVLLR